MYDLITFVQGCAMVFTFGFFISGSAAALKIHRQKSVKNVNFLPYLMATMNCFLWATYGMLKSDYLLIFVNSVGFSLQLIYIFIFLQNCDKKPEYLRRVFVLVTVCFFAASFAYLGGGLFNVIDTLGLASSSVTVVMFASPLSTLRNVVATKNSETISFPLSLMTVCCGTSWWYYGFLIKDTFVQVPNMLGLLLGVVQLIMIYKYQPQGNVVSV